MAHLFRVFAPSKPETGGRGGVVGVAPFLIGIPLAYRYSIFLWRAPFLLLPANAPISVNTAVDTSKFFFEHGRTTGPRGEAARTALAGRVKGQV